jgi:hypothetical protein
VPAALVIPAWATLAPVGVLCFAAATSLQLLSPQATTRRHQFEGKTKCVFKAVTLRPGEVQHRRAGRRLPAGMLLAQLFQLNLPIQAYS